MRLPQCASSIDVPIDLVDVSLVTDLAAIPDADLAAAEPVPEDTPDIETVPEIIDPNNLTPDENPDVNTARAEDDDSLAVDQRPTEKPADASDAPVKTDDPLIEKTLPKAASDSLDFLDDLESQLKTKSRTQRAKTPSDEPPPIQKPVLDKAQAPRAGAGERKGNTASLQASLRRQIEYCWRGIEDLPAEDQIDVVLDMSLAEDGALLGEPALVTPRSRPVGRTGIPVDIALRAVRRCAPYKLPIDDYEYWKDIRVTVGPRR
jgi:hypothetical protein